MVNDDDTQKEVDNTEHTKGVPELVDEVDDGWRTPGHARFDKERFWAQVTAEPATHVLGEETNTNEPGPTDSTYEVQVAGCEQLYNGKPVNLHKRAPDPFTIEDGPALKYDAGKPRYDLIPAYALLELAKVYEFGVRKYSDRNWEKGLNFGQVFRSIMSHSWAFWRGEEFDEESRLHHMAHAAWNCLALLEYCCTGKGTDDRSPHYGIDRPKR